MRCSTASRIAIAALALASLCGCHPADVGVGDVDGGLDAGQTDAGRVDAGELDAGAADAGSVDAGEPDAGPPDAGSVDAGERDAGPLDAGPVDAGPLDAGTVDAGSIDAGSVDAGGLGCMLSIAPNPSTLSGTADKAAELAYVERLVNTDNGTTGWKLAAARLYTAWGDTLFAASATAPNGGTLQQRILASGHHLLLSIKPQAGAGAIPSGGDTTAVWNAIAAGTADADLARHVSELQAMVTSTTWNPEGRTIYLTYHHEMDGDGDATAYVPMWRHVVDYYQAHMSAAARARIRWVWVPTTYGFEAASGNRAPAYYPGDAYVDYVAYDGYNRLPANNDAPTAHAGTYASFGADVVDPTYSNGQTIFDSSIAWARANTHGSTPGPSGLPPSAFGSKPQHIWEWGCWPMVVPPANFPGGTGNETDFGTTMLAASLNATATTMQVVRGSGNGAFYFPKKGPYAVIVDPGAASEEKLVVGAGGTTAVVANQLQNLTRTGGKAHASGATVVLAEDKGDGTGTGMRARFIRNAGAQLEQHWTDVELISYFSSTFGAGAANQEWAFYTRLSVNDASGTAWVEDADSRMAFSSMALDPYFGGR